MYVFTFLINGSCTVQIVDSKFEDAEFRAKELFFNQISKFQLVSICERG